MEQMRCVCFVLFLLSSTVLTATAKPPKLIVSIVVDQLRCDYLARFEKLLVKDGFRRLMEHGAFLTNASYNYVPTYTGPGHASYLSGSVPALNGIIGNEWYDRRAGKRIYCVYDSSARTIGSLTEAGKMSPREFIGSSFADELLIATSYRSKVIGIALKDRSSILPVGKRPTGAYWFDYETGDFITSTYYRSSLPKWVEDFNAKKSAEHYLGKHWEKSLPERDYDFSDTDEGHGEGTLPGEHSTTFPHAVLDLQGTSYTRFESFRATPFANQMTLEFAKSAILGENLGQDNIPDLLAISFSANDYCGHLFGPYSQEVQDITLQLDRQLADFFQFLDRKIGREHLLIVLTADHGMAPTPEYSQWAGLGGTRIKEQQVRQIIEQALQRRFGEGKYVADFVNQQFYLNDVSREQGSPTRFELEEFIGRTAVETGLAQAYLTRSQLSFASLPEPFGKSIVNGFFAARSGDVILILKPFDILTDDSYGSTHGSPYSYDTHVPLFFYGSGVRPGRYTDQVSISDIVPTLCLLFNIEQPSGCIGKPIQSLIAQPRGDSSTKP
jgi:predicted AlkP superfamily pyrophosphatase or phosphodiesterase